MSNVAITKNSPNPSQLSAAREWDPFRAMRDLFRWDPFSEITPLLRQGELSFNPAFNVKETGENFIFSADLPGVKDNDIEIALAQNRLSVSGKREAEKTEKGETYYSYERSFGSFTRSFTLPEGVDSDKVHAELKEGVLKIVLPKKPESAPKRVTVKT